MVEILLALLLYALLLDCALKHPWMWEAFRARYEDARSLACYHYALARLWCCGAPPRPCPKARRGAEACPVEDDDFWP